MKVVPQAFYQNSKIEKILWDGLSCALEKTVSHTDTQNQRYLASHAITLVRNGKLQIETYEGKVRVVQKNELILLPKGMYMISDIIPKNDFFNAMVFFFDDDVCDAFLSNFEQLDSKKVFGTLRIDFNEDLRLFTDTLTSLYKGRNQNQFTRAKLIEFLHLIALSKQGKDFINRLQSLKARERKSIRSFMEEHFDKPLDIDDYAYLTGRSVSTFQRDFKRRFHISPKKWLIQKRLDKAALLLRTTANSVNAITVEVGYENTSHFIKAFHKNFGISPKQYQIQYRKNALI
ncbi:helix-turn-helix domain-containing protein [Ulvibacterium sp.]|uniref:helix-turn-helix domain-containing protein n=1 Tax=Ulvibacterium sp. TaxID=2665914 RepID=UPI00260482D3|nr:AraC family transcriptional regulator [Ulvibacterium sp.]